MVVFQACSVANCCSLATSKAAFSSSILVSLVIFSAAQVLVNFDQTHSDSSCSLVVGSSVPSSVCSPEPLDFYTFPLIV